MRSRRDGAVRSARPLRRAVLAAALSGAGAAVALTPAAGLAAGSGGSATAAVPGASAAGARTAASGRAVKARTAGPTVRQMVVFRDGRARVATVRAAAVTVAVGRRRCAVAAGTPLAALVLARPGRLSIVDYGACSRRPADSGLLFVRSIGRDRNRGSDGWVYKVGNRLATAGAANPSGPFGRGRLRSGSEVTWFYCRMTPSTGACQRTLATSAQAGAGGAVTVRVLAYDDAGRSVPAAGASVRVGAAQAVADGDGVAHLTVASGAYEVVAQSPGAVGSMPRRLAVG